MSEEQTPAPEPAATPLPPPPPTPPPPPSEDDLELRALRDALSAPLVQEASAPAWIVTFGDMMSLFLAFFILMVSFTRLESQGFRDVSASMMHAFGVQEVTPAFEVQRTEPSPTPALFDAGAVESGLQAIVSRARTRDPEGRLALEVRRDDRGVVLTVGDEGFFEAGKADVRPEAWPLLDDVIALAQLHPGVVQVEAHTDDRPIRSALFADNDRLSASRATAVVHYLADREPTIPAARLEAVALGATRPLAPNLDEVSRKRNRRIELRFRPPERVRPSEPR